MPNATDGNKYDFKRSGDPDNNDRNYHHRGSLWSTNSDGTKVFGTARDAGNFAAGYISGLNNLSWGASRLGFDVLELLKSGHREGLQSTLSQRMGHNLGYPIGQRKALDRAIDKMFRESQSPTGPKY